MFPEKFGKNQKKQWRLPKMKSKIWLKLRKNRKQLGKIRKIGKQI
jgi:hypothetical protein